MITLKKRKSKAKKDSTGTVERISPWPPAKRTIPGTKKQFSAESPKCPRQAGRSSDELGL